MVECTYCGILANTLDHIIPVSYNYTSRKCAKYSPELTVPCCSECNNKLSNNWLPSISERAEYLIVEYNKKYKKILNSPDWEIWEINNLSGFLKSKVKSNLKKKKDIQGRLGHLKEISKERDLIPIEIWNKYPSKTYSKFN